MTSATARLCRIVVQLRGWRMGYLPDVVVPAELPAQISAFKRQQARWAQGSIQTALKLLGLLLRSAQPWSVKLEGVVHLTSYLVHPLMLLVVLLTLPMSFSGSWVLAAARWLMIAAAGPPLLYTVAQVADGSTEPSSRAQAEGLTKVGEHWRYRLRVLPLLVLLGMGLALSNTRAVLKAALLRHRRCWGCARGSSARPNSPSADRVTPGSAASMP